MPYRIPTPKQRYVLHILHGHDVIFHDFNAILKSHRFSIHLISFDIRAQILGTKKLILSVPLEYRNIIFVKTDKNLHLSNIKSRFIFSFHQVLHYSKSFKKYVRSEEWTYGSQISDYLF